MFTILKLIPHSRRISLQLYPNPRSAAPALPQIKKKNKLEKTHSDSAGNDCFDICLFVLAAYVIREASLSDYLELVSLCNGMLEEFTSGIKTMWPQIHQKINKKASLFPSTPQKRNKSQRRARSGIIEEIDGR